MKEKIKRVIKETEFINYICIILIATLLAIPIFSEKLNVYFDDGIQHIARAYGTLASIKEQGFTSNIISSFTNNFGYSWNLFYGPLSSLGIILVNFVCQNFITAYKIFCFICLIFSGFTMYKFMLSVTKNSNTSLLASVLYISFPYHLTDWYIRNALGEFVSFIFVPLVFLGLYNLFYTEEKHYYLSLGAIGLILTHNLSTIITCIFSAVYVLVHFKSLKETRVKKGIAISLIFILLVTSFFWLPVIETKMSANYQVYEKDAMSTKESVLDHRLDIKELFVTQTNDIYVYELGIHIIIMLCFSIVSLKRLREDLRKQYIFCLISAVICILMTTRLWPWQIMPEATYMIQFPWRMLSMAGFFLSAICSINMAVTLKKFNIKDVVVLSIISITYVFALCNFVPYTDNISNIESFSLGVMSGKDFEVVAGTAKAEYLPKKAFDNRFYIATREDATYVLKGKAIIENEEKNGTNYKAKIKTVEKATIFELPYIYYPGYEVRVDGAIIDNFETENGFLGVVLDANEDVELTIKYTGTTLMKISIIVSLIGIVCFSVYIWKKH